MQKDYYLKFRKKSKILITAEHASKRIPKEYKSLGLKKRELDGAKDLYDLGSLELLQILEKKIQASYLYANISRLVIDHNRVLNGKNKSKNSFHSGAMKKELLIEKNKKEVVVKIPANIFSNEKDFFKEENLRYEKYVEAYKKAGYKMIELALNSNKKVIVIMVHSFFPVYNGDKRKIDISVSYDASKKLALKIIKNIKKSSNLVVGDNKPWKLSDVDGGIFVQTKNMKNVELVAFDVNNKNLKTEKDRLLIADLIYQAIKNL